MVKILLIEQSLSNRILIQSRVPDYCTVITVPEPSEAVSLLSVTVVDAVIAGPSAAAEKLSALNGFITGDESVDLIVLSKKSENDDAADGSGTVKLRGIKTLGIPEELDKIDHILSAIVSKKLRKMTADERHLINRRMSKLVGSSDSMIRVKTEILSLCNAPGPVLISGESGTGKEIVAGLLHEFSERGEECYNTVNAGAFQRGLSAAELFGATAGAYTGAVNRQGYFEYTSGGTLFLDEIGDVELSVQTELLRVLETGKVRKLVANSHRSVDVRLLCATNKNLAGEAEAGRFRRDLLYRIDVFRIQIPPLRERKEDIPDLLMYFSDQLRRDRPNKYYDVSDSFINRRFDYDWPGNVRELRNVFHRAVYSSDSGVLTADSIKTGY